MAPLWRRLDFSLALGEPFAARDGWTEVRVALGARSVHARAPLMVLRALDATWAAALPKTLAVDADGRAAARTTRPASGARKPRARPSSRRRTIRAWARPDDAAAVRDAIMSAAEAFSLAPEDAPSEGDDARTPRGNRQQVAAAPRR